EFRLDAETRAALGSLRASDVVDYPAVAELKWRALRSAFAAFKAGTTLARRSDFEKFRGERGSLLSHFACFEALRHRFKKPWWEWPAEWRQPHEPPCGRLSRGAGPGERRRRDAARASGLRGVSDAAEIEFVEFVHWTADRQLAAAKDLAHELG